LREQVLAPHALGMGDPVLIVEHQESGIFHVSFSFLRCGPNAIGATCQP
jgi:hypothetical protein